MLEELKEEVRAANPLQQQAALVALTRGPAPTVGPISDELRDKHFLRKHGPEVYYGQTEEQRH